MTLKKLILLLLLTFGILSSCSSHQHVPLSSRSKLKIHSDTSSQIQKSVVVPKKKTVSTSSSKIKNTCIISLNSNFLSDAQKGQFEGIPAVLGKPKDEIIQDWGKPSQVDTSNHHYLKYGECVFYVTPQNNVSSIMIINKNHKITTDYVQKQLGKVTSAGPNQETNGYLMYYSEGKNAVYIEAKSKGAIVSDVLLKSK